MSAAPLIARAVLLGAPERTRVQLSPDGGRVAWLAPDGDGVSQIWSSALDGTDARPRTAAKRAIRAYCWAEDGRTLLHLQDLDGDEGFHLYAVALEAGGVRDLTPFERVRAELVATAAALPDTILVALNRRDERWHDVYRCTLSTGALGLDTENPGDVARFIADARLAVRAAEVILPDGGCELRVRDTAAGAWRTLLRVDGDDHLRVIGFAADGDRLFLETSSGSDTARLVAHELSTGAATVLASRPDVDVADVLLHPTRLHVQAASFMPARTSWQIIDADVAPDFAALQALGDGDVSIVSRDRRDETWVVALQSDCVPVRYYAWSRATRSHRLLFSERPALATARGSAMRSVTIAARDGLQLPAYLTLPAGDATQPPPLVLDVHGGPWTRDVWGFDEIVQWLANRGYAVLQVNFRGSTGYGKRFLHAGDNEWGRRMQDDLVDAVHWAVERGYADGDRVAIHGGSYGGYAALAAAAFTPRLFRCAVAAFAPSNLVAMLRNRPPYWEALASILTRRVGDPDADGERLRSVSPLLFAERIEAPVLLGHGANDPRLSQDDSPQLFAALERRGADAILVSYPDEGHGFVRPENRIDFFARVERFLAEHLGGRCEPLDGERVPGSTAIVRRSGGFTPPR